MLEGQIASPLLSFTGVQKSFEGIFALRDVTFDVREGECLALVGENGAGKSTLMKILSGVWPEGSFAGELKFRGKRLCFRSPLDARRQGISIIHQELCLFPKLTVAENLFLTEAFPYDGQPSQKLFGGVHWGALQAQADSLLKELGFEVDSRATIESLSVAQRQLVEIARAFHHQARLLILDEPTSALSTKEVQHLFEVVRRMRQKNVTFIYITHKFDEIFALADRIVVLRDGQAVASLVPKETNEAELIRHMVGRPLIAGGKSAREATSENKILEVANLSHRDEKGRTILSHISFDVRVGEVLGIAGLMGSGRSELLRSLLGVLPGERTGQVRFNGKTVAWRGIAEAMDDGVAFVPEDRKKDGLFLDQGVDFNLTISVLRQLVKRLRMLDLSKEESLVARLVSRMGVKVKRTTAPVRVLSGGNQQKVLLAKVVASSPKVLLLDEPTRGIDVGAKEDIYEIIRELAKTGITVVLVSSELPEILALSNRVLVLREGKAMGELVNEKLTQERVMALAAGAGGLNGVH